MIPNEKGEPSFWLEHAVESKVIDCYGGSCAIGK